jgi:hypothetical protein
MNVQHYRPIFVQSLYTWFAPRPMAAALHPCRQSQPARRSRSRQRSEKTEGKIKGRGTLVRVKPCLHVGWRGTRFGCPCAVRGAKAVPALIEWRALSAGLGSAALEFMP